MKYFDVHCQYDKNHGESFYIKTEEDIDIEDEDRIFELVNEKYLLDNVKQFVDEIYEMTEEEWMEYFHIKIPTFNKKYEGNALYCHNCENTWDVDNYDFEQNCPDCGATTEYISHNPFITCSCGTRVYFMNNEDSYRCEHCDKTVYSYVENNFADKMENEYWNDKISNLSGTSYHICVLVNDCYIYVVHIDKETYKITWTGEKFLAQTYFSFGIMEADVKILLNEYDKVIIELA